MAKYKNIPMELDAIQFKGLDRINEVMDFVESFGDKFLDTFSTLPFKLTGEPDANQILDQDFIVRAEDGRYAVMKPSRFLQRFQLKTE